MGEGQSALDEEASRYEADESDDDSTGGGKFDESPGDDDPAPTAEDELVSGRGNGEMAGDKEGPNGGGEALSEVDCPCARDVVGDNPTEDNEDEVIPPKSNISVDVGGT